MSHGDPKNPKRNPHPVKRYQITAVADAPGSWDSVKGYLHYDVVNEACTPKNDVLGVHVKPPGVGVDIEMTRVDEKTWKGYFYRDYLQDEDYYGLGVCHWDGTGVAGVFTIHGEKFASSSVLDGGVQKGDRVSYFSKQAYGDAALSGDSSLGLGAANPRVLQQPGAYFPITVTVTEAVP